EDGDSCHAPLPGDETSCRRKAPVMIRRDLQALACPHENSTERLPSRECSYEHFVRFARELTPRPGAADLASRGAIEVRFINQIVIDKRRNDEHIHVELGSPVSRQGKSRG